MTDKYTLEVAWNKKGKSKNERNRLIRERIKKKLGSSARNVKITALHMGKSVSRKAYQQGKAIHDEQERQGGFYNLAKKTNVTKVKRKVKYLYLKPKKRHRHKIKVKRIKQRIKLESNYNSSNPFGLSI